MISARDVSTFENGNIHIFPSRFFLNRTVDKQNDSLLNDEDDQMHCIAVSKCFSSIADK